MPTSAVERPINGAHADLKMSPLAMSDGNIWFAFDESRPLAIFAGLWTSWTSVRKVKEGETKNDLFALLTKGVAPDPHHPEEIDMWRTAPPDKALKLQRPLPDGVLRIILRGEKEDVAA